MTTKTEYQDYLLSDYWKKFSHSIRVQRKKCERCGCSPERSRHIYRQELHVHHKTYERIGKELSADVELVCWACHIVIIHNNKTTIGIAPKVLAAKMAFPQVEPFEAKAICGNCKKTVQVGRLWNQDELRQLDDYLCQECQQ